MSSITFFIKYCWQHNKKYIIYTFSYQLVISMLSLMVVVIPKFIIDELVGHQRIDYLIFYVGLLLGSQFFGGWFANHLKKQAFIQKSLLFITFQSELTKKMATADFEKIESAEFLDQKEKATKFLYGNGEGFGVVFDNFASILGNTFVFLGIVGIIATLNIYLLIVFICLAVITSYFDHKTKQKYAKWDMEKAPVERKTSYLTNTIESFQYAKEIRIFDLSSWLTKKVDTHLSQVNTFYIKQISESTKVETINLFASFIRDCFAYLFLIVQFFAKKITIGDFTMYISAINTFSQLMKQLLESLATIRQYENYFEALTVYIQMPQRFDDTKGEVPRHIDNVEIIFNDVSFKYPNADKYSLKDINFSVKAGDKVAIVGENGAGKTTLIKLICRLYQPTEGEILMNGIDIQTIPQKEFTKLIATVFQDFKLFSFSIRDNLVFENQEDIPDKLIQETLINNGFNLDKYPNSIDTSIYKNFDEYGFEPSGGEGQKIALSRAELKKAPIIILDEPTAAMDPKAEIELYTRFSQLTKNRTTFFISHRLASTKFCDYIFCLNNGEIIEKGTHEELILKDGMYNELYNMQAELYKID